MKFENVKTIDTKISPKDGMQMVYVPGGEFIMGDEWEKEDEERFVYLDAYWIDQTPVTNGMYAQFLNEMFDEYKAEMENEVFWCINDRQVKSTDGVKVMDGYENHPVMGVTWYGAQAYCKWAGKILPTEAQWEKAARGTDGRVYPWGQEDLHPDLLNYEFGDAVGDSTIVGSFPKGASPYGALDMLGNVWEWVADCFDEDYYTRMPRRNPFNNDGDPEIRILRGGSFSCGEQYLSADSRRGEWADVWSQGGPYMSLFGYGFRCCLPAE